MNTFYEQFISKDYKGKPNAINIISKGVLLFSIGMFAALGILGIFVAIPGLIIFAILEIFLANNFLEYEYEYYDREIVISKIIGKKRRKVLGNISTGNIIKVSTDIEASKKEGKIIRCTAPSMNLKEVVIFANDKNNQKVGYLMGLDDNLYSILKKDNPNLFNYI